MGEFLSKKTGAKLCISHQRDTSVAEDTFIKMSDNGDSKNNRKNKIKQRGFKMKGAHKQDMCKHMQQLHICLHTIM